MAFFTSGLWVLLTTVRTFQAGIVVLVLLMVFLPRDFFAATTNFAGNLLPGTNVYSVTNKPIAGSQINWSRPLSAGLVSAVPVNEGAGANFYDAVKLQSYVVRTLSGSPAGATPSTWFIPAFSADYPWSGPAISNNGTNAQAIQSAFQELDLINNITNGYSYAALVQRLDTTTFGRIMDATGAAVITIYLNVAGKLGRVATTWRNAAGTAIVPSAPFTVNQWMLVLCTVQQGQGVMYLNGAPAASDANVNLAKSWTNQTGQLVYNATGNGSLMCNVNFSSWWIWSNRVLTAQEAADMYANPWAMFHSGSQKGFIKGTKLVLTNTAFVSDVRFYSHVAVGNLRLSIYDNGTPKNLLWQSGSISNTVTSNWITAPISSGSPTSLTLTNGTCWLVWQVDTTYDVPGYTAGANGDGFFIGQGFGSFPATLSGEQSSSETWGMYLSFTSNAPAPLKPAFTFFNLTTNGAFLVEATSTSNTSFRVQASSNLSNWIDIGTNVVSPGGVLDFLDVEATNFLRRFYRFTWP